MRLHQFGLGLALLVSCVVAGSSASRAVAQTAVPSTLDLEIDASGMGFDTPVTVRLYRNGAAEVPQAILVFLHGFGQDHAAFGELGGIESLRGLDTPLLVVAPGGGSHGFTDAAHDGPDWSSFLLRELVPALAEHVEGLRPDAPLGLGGVSAGGARALALGLAHPDRVACVTAHSAALHPPDPGELPDWARGWDGWAYGYGDPIDPDLWRADNAIWLAAQLGDPASAPGIRFDVGRDDHLGFQATAGLLASTLAANRVPFEFAVRDGGHGDDFYRSHLQESLAFQASCLARSASRG